jgi:hypothetical protein
LDMLNHTVFLWKSLTKFGLIILKNGRILLNLQINTERQSPFLNSFSPNQSNKFSLMLLGSKIYAMPVEIKIKRSILKKWKISWQVLIKSLWYASISQTMEWWVKYRERPK